jgi:large subunit ribosomal protein L15
MLQHELRPPHGATHARKRVGRGNATGNGTYAGKGLKGQQARAGSGPRRGFEGGQTPIIRRFKTRRGFRNPFATIYQPVNLKRLTDWPVEREVTPETLLEARVVRSLDKPIKLLSDGEATSALRVRVHRVSATARTKVEAAGGSIEELTPKVERKRNRKHLRKQAQAAAPAGAPEAKGDEEKPAEEPKAGESEDDGGSSS